MDRFHSRYLSCHRSLTHSLTRSLTFSLLQIARAKEIKSHFLASQAHAGADARKLSDIATNGVIVSLGLITPEGGEGGSGGPGEGQKH